MNIQDTSERTEHNDWQNETKVEQWEWEMHKQVIRALI